MKVQIVEYTRYHACGDQGSGNNQRGLFQGATIIYGQIIHIAQNLRLGLWRFGTVET